MEEGKKIQEALEKLLGKKIPLTEQGKINKRFVPKKYRDLVDDYYSNKSKTKEEEIKNKLQDLFDNLKQS